jgi:hypothetical protein
MTAHVTVMMVGGKPHIISIHQKSTLDRCGQIFGRTNSGDRFELHCGDQALARGGSRTFATSPEKKETTCEAERSNQVLRLTQRHPRDLAPAPSSRIWIVLSGPGHKANHGWDCLATTQRWWRRRLTLTPSHQPTAEQRPRSRVKPSPCL